MTRANHKLIQIAYVDQQDQSLSFMALYASHMTRVQYLVVMRSFQFDTGRNIESH